MNNHHACKHALNLSSLKCGEHRIVYFMSQWPVWDIHLDVLFYWKKCEKVCWANWWSVNWNVKFSFINLIPHVIRGRWEHIVLSLIITVSMSADLFCMKVVVFELEFFGIQRLLRCFYIWNVEFNFWMNFII